MKTINTREWIESVRAGDKSLIDTLYLEHREEFLRWANKKYGTERDDLVEIYQNAVIQMYENIIYDKITELESGLKTYLFGIAKNLIHRSFRIKKRDEKHGEQIAEHWIFQKLNTDNEIHKLVDGVGGLLEELGDPCKSIIEMFYIEDHDMDTISKNLGYKSSDVAKNQKARCMKKLRVMAQTLLNE